MKAAGGSKLEGEPPDGAEELSQEGSWEESCISTSLLPEYELFRWVTGFSAAA